MDDLERLEYISCVIEMLFSILKPFIFMVQYGFSWHVLNTQMYCLEKLGYYDFSDPAFNVFIPASCSAFDAFDTTRPEHITVKNSSCVANPNLFGQTFGYCGTYDPNHPKTHLSTGIDTGAHIFLGFSFLSGILGYIITALLRAHLRARVSEGRANRCEKYTTKLLCYFFEATGPWLFMRSFFNAGPRAHTYIATPDNCDSYVYCNDFCSTLTGISIFLVFIGICCRGHEGALLTSIPILAIGSGIGLLVQSIKLHAPTFITGLDFTFLKEFE